MPRPPRALDRMRSGPRSSAACGRSAQVVKTSKVMSDGKMRLRQKISVKKAPVRGAKKKAPVRGAKCQEDQEEALAENQCAPLRLGRVGVRAGAAGGSEAGGAMAGRRATRPWPWPTLPAGRVRPGHQGEAQDC